MKLLKTKILALLIMGLVSLSLSGQEAILTTGSTATGSGGSASYSVGQVVYATNSGSNGSVNQGVQQAYIISEETGINQAREISLNHLVYPNPTTDYLILKIEEINIETSDFQYFLYDIGGKLIQNDNVRSLETTIDFSQLSSANYLLRIIQKGKEIKTYKIIKN